MITNYLNDGRLSFRDKGVMSLIVSLGKEFMKEEDSMEYLLACSIDKEENFNNAVSQLRKYGYFFRCKDENGEFLVFINEKVEVE